MYSLIKKLYLSFPNSERITGSKNNEIVVKYIQCRYHSMLKIESTPVSPPATKFLPVHSMAQRAAPDWKVSKQLFILKSQILMLLSNEQLKTILLSVGCALTQDTVYL